MAEPFNGQIIIETQHITWPLDKWLRVGGEHSVYSQHNDAVNALNEYLEEYEGEWTFRLSAL